MKRLKTLAVVLGLTLAAPAVAQAAPVKPITKAQVQKEYAAAKKAQKALKAVPVPKNAKRINTSKLAPRLGARAASHEPINRQWACIATAAQGSNVPSMESQPDIHDQALYIAVVRGSNGAFNKAYFGVPPDYYDRTGCMTRFIYNAAFGMWEMIDFYYDVWGHGNTFLAWARKIHQPGGWRECWTDYDGPGPGGWYKREDGC